MAQAQQDKEHALASMEVSKTSRQMQIIQSNMEVSLWWFCRLTSVDDLLRDELASRLVVLSKLGLAKGPG